MADNRTGSVYRVIQLGAPRGANGIQTNETVEGFDGLTTHHPGANRNARMQDGVIVGGQPRRALGFIDGEMQEIEIARDGRNFGLEADRVLVKKDFILENPNFSYMSGAARVVDVPSPVGGYIGRVSEREGLVDILDHQGGEVIARIRHMHPIAVAEGQTVEYGEALGTQGRQQTGAVHVHMEMDTRYYQQFENYVNDLVSGRLPVEAEYRTNVRAQPVVDDGVMRLGEAGEQVAAVQRALAADGYRATGDKPIAIDGVYRPDMQGALLAFQQDHRIPQTGDIDPATYQLALRVNLDKPLGPLQFRREETMGLALPQAIRDAQRGLDPNYTPRSGQPAPDTGYPHDPARTQRAPNHHAHPDHDPLPPLELPRTPDSPGHPDHALLEHIRQGVRRLDQQAGRSWDEDSERLSASLLTKAKEKGFSERDDLVVAFNKPVDKLAGGEIVHLFRQGGGVSPDPAANRAHVRTADAVATPVEQSYKQVETITHSQTQAQQLEQQQAIDAQVRSGPIIS